MSYNAEYWRDRIAAAAPDLPTDRLVAWIAEESGGSPSALGAVYEVGIFQLDLQDGAAYGGTLATLHGNFSASPSSQTRTRDLTDDEEALQVTSGVAYVRHCLSVAQRELDGIGASWEDDDLWCLVKFQHALPALPKYTLPSASNAGAAGSWGDYRAYVTGLSRSEVDSITYNSCGRYMPFDRLFDNAEKVGGASGVAGALSGFVPGFIDLNLILGMGGALLALYLVSAFLPHVGGVS